MGTHKRTPTLTIRLDRELQRQLKRVAAGTGRSRCDLVRDGPRRRLAPAQSEELRRRVGPFAEARGFLACEDIPRIVS